jgi:NADPH:quinone reductase-like Zn-dependent oxidoreductase
LILGAGGSVGIIATQLAIRQGLNVIAAVGVRDEALTRELGATPVRYGSNLLSNVREVADRVDATFDAAGKGELEDAIALTGGSERVITLADEHAAELGVRLSPPTPDRAPDAVEIGMELLASGELRLRSQQSLPMSAAAEAHRLLEGGNAHHKLLLATSPQPAEVAK